MKKIVYVVVSLGLLATILLAGCTPTPETNTRTGTTATPTQTISPIVTPSSSPTQTASPQPQAADDLMFTPGGTIVYRANGNPQWPAIPTVTKTFVAGTDTIYVTYRDYIETKAGQTRNNIISMYDSVGQIRVNQVGPDPSPNGRPSITYTVVGLPAGITADMDGVIKFHVENSVSPAQYSLQINVKVDGAVYTLPCTIKVL